MKKLLTAIFALLLLAALTMSAMAYTMYVASDPGKVYNGPGKSYDCISRLPQGGAVDVFDEDGGWSHISYINKKGVQKSGWIKSKNLTSNAPCHHEWSKWKIIKEPTCTKNGEKSHYCLLCGIVRTKEIKKTGHDWGPWKITEDATCIDAGLKTRTCRNCGKKQTEEFYADHEFGEWRIVREPTCTEAGQREHTCVVCSYVETRAIDKLPHEFEYKIIEEATDHSAGIRARVCQVCGYTEDAVSYDPEGTLRKKDRGPAVSELQQLLVDQGYLKASGADGVYGGGTEKAIKKFQEDQGLTADGVAWPQTQAMLKHDFGPWEMVNEPTRTEPGQRQRVCKDCGYVQYETIVSGESIERGARGENVRALQKILKALGYDAGGVDGIYGKKLDAAFSAFCADNGMTYDDGKVTPAEMDVLINAWLAADANGMSEGGEGSPVNLALSVTATSGEAEDESAPAYTWSLTNLGSGKCVFNALLLTYGANPDFSQDDLVLVIDGFELKANSGNSASGSFTVAKSWGDGNLNFAALAVDEKTGQKYLSNTVVYEVAGSSEPRTVEPMNVALNVSALPDGTYQAAFDRGDIAKVTSGIYMNAVHIFTPDTYAISDIEGLREGDTVVIEGESIQVASVQNQDGTILINGGLLEGGRDFILTEDGSAYQIQDEDDYTTYTDCGMTTLQVDPSVVYTDASDIDSDVITADYDGLMDAIQSSDNDSFNQYNTLLTIQGGKVVEIYRSFMP